MMSASTAFPILPRRFESNSGNRRLNMPRPIPRKHSAKRMAHSDIYER
jgi:hypothetical protein